MLLINSGSWRRKTRMSKLKIAVVGLVDVTWGGAHSAQELALNEFISSVEKNDEIYIYEKGWVDLQKSVETKTVVLRDLDYTRQENSAKANHNILRKILWFAFRRISALKFFSKIFSLIQGRRLWLIQKRIKPVHYGIEQKLLDLDIQLVYFMSHPHHQKDFSQLPYFSTLWDTGHRDLPNFPEVSAKREFEIREEALGASFKKSLAIFVESNELKSKLVRFYGVSEESIFVNKFAPTKSLSTSELSKEEYVLYPAQFWPHKNHIVLFEAISNIRARGDSCRRLILTGRDKGNLAFLLKKIAEFDIDKYVEIKGFLCQDELTDLYRGAAVLAMPSLLGPTNLPPLEAMLFGVPVFVSQEGSFEINHLSGVTVLDGWNSRDWEKVFLFNQSLPEVDSSQINSELLSRQKVNIANYRHNLIRARKSLQRFSG
jgi:glycosyltransferase involved in cell wall biosynthesis